MVEFRVFLSAVSSEFGSARDTLAASLRSRDLLLRVQSDFRQQAMADTTLRKLHDYIRDCGAVVCAHRPAQRCDAAGRFRRAVRAHAAAGDHRSVLHPVGVLLRPPLQTAAVALHRHAMPGSLTNPRPLDDRPDLQQALIRYIVDEQGLDRDYFDNVDRLCHLVLKEDWPRELPPKPIVLPYPSLGTLFKGRDAFLPRLRASLTRADGGAAAIAGRAVHGMGGVGKTRAAVEYAWAHRDDYTALLLLEAETPEKLQSSLAALVGPLRLAEHAAADEAVRMEAALGLAERQPAAGS